MVEAYEIKDLKDRLSDEIYEELKDHKMITFNDGDYISVNLYDNDGIPFEFSIRSIQIKTDYLSSLYTEGNSEYKENDDYTIDYDDLSIEELYALLSNIKEYKNDRT